MFKLYRPLTKGEFFVVFGDTAQGGIDSNYIQFLSKTKADFPLVMKSRGVVAEITPFLIQALEYIYDQTGVPPCIALERQNGGQSAMHDLMVGNRQGKYTIYLSKTQGSYDGQEDTDKLGWDTTSVSRPKMLGEWLVAFNTKQFKIYDKDTIDQHKTFIVAKNGKPQAASNAHDDAVMSCAGAYQLYQTENPAIKASTNRPKPKRLKFHV